MLFNSKVFVVFLLVVLAVYYRLGHHGKLWFLLGMSYVFYGFWNPWLCTLIFLSTLVDFWCGRRLGRTRDPGARRLWLGVSLVSNLGMLGFFKYFNFFLDSLAFSLTGVGLPIDLAAWHLDLILPVGISFYTFQTLSYTIDVYRGKLAPEESLRDFALYVSFFPQLVAGPVERASHLLPQYKKPFRLERRQVYEGVFLVLLGFVKKVVIGDRLARMIDPHFADPVSSGPVALLSLLLFTTDIYVDFSAYSDIAIGLGRLLGYDIRPNFDLPFVVPSIPERWRRWHISMGHWFRDYVYIPLGGSRHGEHRAQANVLAVMFLSGLWHGASYNFVVWGALNGLAMVGHHYAQPVLRPIAALMDRHPATRVGYFYLCCWNTMLMISGINIFFRSDSFAVARSYVESLFLRSPWQYVDAFLLGNGRWPREYEYGIAWMVLVFLVHEAERYAGLKRRVVEHRALWWIVCAGMYLAILIWGIKGPQFIYYQF